NFQTDDKPLLQTFLLGQPEFRKTMLSSEMQQLRQRVTATYHLGPMDSAETRAYIEHRLKTAGWNGNPSFDDDAFAAIHNYTDGIPRKINALCDRLLLMGYLEQLPNFGSSEVNEVICDIQHEFDMSVAMAGAPVEGETQTDRNAAESLQRLEEMAGRVANLEESVVSLMILVKRILSLADVSKRLR
ncbi:MAG TPA: ATPase, partial [Nitrosospira sp.]|nr:ATPase [Nitrosospira sp.]